MPVTATDFKKPKTIKINRKNQTVVDVGLGPSRKNIIVSTNSLGNIAGIEVKM